MVSAILMDQPMLVCSTHTLGKLNRHPKNTRHDRSFLSPIKTLGDYPIAEAAALDKLRKNTRQTRNLPYLVARRDVRIKANLNPRFTFPFKKRNRVAFVQKLTSRMF